jgi:hypothetical protein
MGWGAANICASKPGSVVALMLVFIVVGAILLTVAYYIDWQWKLTLSGSAFVTAGIIVFTYCGINAWFVGN